MHEKLRYIAITLGALLALMHQFWNIPPLIDIIFMTLLLLLVGIPHGAIDHLVDEHNVKAQQKPFSLFRFLAVYIAQMAVYAICWWLFPALSLLVFLLISAWHFGETDLHPSPNHIAWAILKGLFGTAILFFILLREPLYTASLIERITLGNSAASGIWQFFANQSVFVFASLIALILVAWFWAQQSEPIRTNKTKWVTFIFLMAVVYFLPLLPAFALYFGAWHAWNTFGYISTFLSSKHTFWNIWKKTLPFTLLALSGLIIMGLVWWFSFSYIDPLPVLFIFIAIITLPHLRVMHHMFKELAKEAP